MKPFNRERFLFYMLGAIFAWQALIFTGAVVGCFRTGIKQACPDLGKRYENTVNVMVATTLALLTGGAVISQGKKQLSGEPEAAPTPKPAVSPKRTKQP